MFFLSKRLSDLFQVKFNLTKKNLFEINKILFQQHKTSFQTNNISLEPNKISYEQNKTYKPNLILLT